MINSILQYLIVFAIFLVIDFVWLGLAAKKLYSKNLGYLMKEKPNFVAAFVFYSIFVVGLMAFVINPAIEKGSLLDALKWGALYGFVTYATYDLTNLATVKDWPIKITLIDLLWGTFVSCATSVLGYIAISTIW
ncbi:MAG: DUF2177 family protein [Eubacteriales bacterium]